MKFFIILPLFLVFCRVKAIYQNADERIKQSHIVPVAEALKSIWKIPKMFDKDFVFTSCDGGKYNTEGFLSTYVPAKNFELQMTNADLHEETKVFTMKFGDVSCRNPEFEAKMVGNDVKLLNGKETAC